MTETEIWLVRAYYELLAQLGAANEGYFREQIAQKMAEVREKFDESVWK